MKTKQHKEPSWRTAVAAAIKALRMERGEDAAVAALEAAPCDDRVVAHRIMDATEAARCFRFEEAISILETL